MPFGELIGCVFIRFRVPFFCCNASSTSGVKPYRSMVLFALFFPFTRISMTVPTVTCVELHNFVEATAWRGFSSSQSWIFQGAEVLQRKLFPRIVYSWKVAIEFGLEVAFQCCVWWRERQRQKSTASKRWLLKINVSSRRRGSNKFRRPWLHSDFCVGLLFDFSPRSK